MNINLTKLQEQYGVKIIIKKPSSHTDDRILQLTDNNPPLNPEPYFSVNKSFGLSNTQAHILAEQQTTELSHIMLTNALLECKTIGDDS